MLPDLVLTLALFPLSYFVMQSFNNPEEVLVNLVALQIFADLDDLFIPLLLRPRQSVGDAIQNYISENPNALVPRYSPQQAYVLSWYGCNMKQYWFQCLKYHLIDSNIEN